MKPTFALNLSNERVGLLHRTGRGWLQIGEVAFDTPDLSEALAYLRKTALGLSPRGLSTKLVIPNTEILYCDVEAPGPDDDTRRTQIRAGLAGRTPYAPEDLVFDWRGKGTMVKVAVVARETLAEAEAFAVEHRLGPVSFVALPDPSQFKGEPFFGQTEAAKTILTKDETVEPDRDAMTIVTRDLPLADVQPEPEERPSRRSERTEKSNSDPISGAVEKLRSSAQPDTPPPRAEPETVPVAPAPVTSTPAPAAIADSPVEVAAPSHVADPPMPKNPTVEVAEKSASVAAPVISEAPFAEVVDIGATVGDTLRGQPFDDLPPAPSPAAQMAFASRRGPDEVARGPGVDIAAGKDRPFGELPGAARADPLANRAVPPVRSDAQVTAPSIPGSKKQRKAGSSTPPPAVAAAAAALANSNASMGKPTKPLTRPGGTFGAKPLPRRGKPRYLGIILTVLLLVGLALIAAWSSYSLVQNETDTRSDAPALASNATGDVAPLPAIDDEILADQEDLALSSDAEAEVTAQIAEPAAADPQPQVVVPAVVAPEVIAEEEAATPLTDELVSIEDEAAADGEPAAAIDVPAAVAEVVAPEPRPVVADTPAVSATAPADAPATAAAPADQIATAVTEVAPSPAPADLSTNPDLTVAGSELAAATALTETTPAAEPEPAAPAPDVALADNLAGPEPRVAAEQPDEIFVAMTDTAPAFQDALQLPDPAFSPDALPAAAPPPPPFGTIYQFDAAGLIVPTPDGIMSPEGFMLFAGPPPLTPPERSPAAAVTAATAASPAPDAIAALPAPDSAAVADAEAEGVAATAAASLVAPAVVPEAAPADPALAGFRPRPRPAGLDVPVAESADDASLTPEIDTRVSELRPRTRPEMLVVASSAAQTDAAAGTPPTRPETLAVAGSTARDESSAASLTAQSNAAVEAALASAAETGNILTLAVSRRPAARPQDMSRAVNAAVAAAVRAPEPAPEPEVASNDAALPEDDAEPEVTSAAPRIPTKTTVAKQATFANAINLSKINLIGVYGTPSKRYALVRLSSGRYKKVSVGDTVDGGRVEAITASEVRYQKSGRLISLKMPRA